MIKTNMNLIDYTRRQLLWYLINNKSISKLLPAITAAHTVPTRQMRFETSIVLGCIEHTINYVTMSSFQNCKNTTD